MNPDSPSLLSVLDGWAGCNTSTVHAIGLLSAEKLAWRLAPDMRSLDEISLMLGLQGIEAFELSALGGHIVLPALADVSELSGAG